MIYKKSLFALLSIICIGSMAGYTQERLSEHILTVDSSFQFNVDFQAEEFTWLTGTWKGTGLGGTVEEVWSEPYEGHMFGIFRYHRGKRLLFSEFCSISNLGDGLKYRVRHFTETFEGWEEKDEYASFPLIYTEPNVAYFDGATFKREGNQLTIYVYINSGEGGREEEFIYQLSE